MWHWRLADAASEGGDRGDPLLRAKDPLLRAKDPLLRAKDPLLRAKDPFLAAKDVVRADGRWSKRFASFRNYSSFLAAVVGSGSSSRMYEVIPDRQATPVWFFADHDCRVGDDRDTLPPSGENITPDEFLAAVVRLHCGYFGIDEPSVQVSSSCREGKLSAHVKINVDLRGGMAEALVHARRIHAVAAAKRPALKPDLAVYTSNQQIRLVGSSKQAHGAKKTPWGLSSTRWRDHFVRRADGSDGQTVTDVRVEAPMPDLARTAPTEPIVGAGLAEERCVRMALKAAGAQEILGPRFDADTCRIEQLKRTTDTIRCNVDGTASRHGGTLVCPFAKRPHTSNRLRVMVTSNGDQTGSVYMWCYSVSCQRKARIRLAYSVASSLAGP